MKKIFFLIGISAVLFSSCKKKDDEVKVADELKYSTDFSEDDHTWFSDANHSITPGSNGYYNMSQSQANYQAWGIAPFSTINYNYSISADMKLYLQNSGLYGSAGLIYNFKDNDHYYVFYVYNNGQFFAYKRDKDFVTLINNTFTAAYKQGQSNHIEVRQSNGSASFLINSTVVGSCPAPRWNGLTSAGVALATTGAPYFTPVTGQFDNVRIKKIQ